MIQRVQTIYLLLAAMISGGLIFIVRLWTEASNQMVFAGDLLSNPSILIKTILFSFLTSSLLSILAIFLFKNRQLQFVVGRVNMIINFYLLGVLIYVSQTISGETIVSEKGIGMFFPIIVVVLLVMANKAIKKDEDLVKSVDRLR
ncbi:MAG: DUF4293 domain-containing protein [Polaribacter sp.]|nr:DUF4293 domain-containing protein [Polaribacter sp.]